VLIEMLQRARIVGCELDDAADLRLIERGFY
jgi:hypothetical protein